MVSLCRYYLYSIAHFGHSSCNDISKRGSFCMSKKKTIPRASSVFVLNNFYIYDFFTIVAIKSECTENSFFESKTKTETIAIGHNAMFTVYIIGNVYCSYIRVHAAITIRRIHKDNIIFFPFTALDL